MHEETVIQIAKSLFYEKTLAKIDGEFVGALASTTVRFSSGIMCR
jgi:hypothetical protein